MNFCYVLFSVMATLRCNKFPALLVLLISLSVSTSALRCRKGVNLSFSGIPLFYFWIDSSCDVGTRCMIQDRSIVSTALNYAYGNVTYGGCFPDKMQRRMSCPISKDSKKDITSDEIDEIGRAFDKIALEMIIDLTLHAEEHEARVYSFGNGIQDLQNGILDLLESVGYDRTKIRHPLHRYIQDSDDMDKLMHFLEALQVECDATTELSASILRHLKDIAHKRNVTIPSYLVRGTEMIPLVIYPIFKSSVDDVDELFHEASKMFKSPHHVPSEETCSRLVISYALMNLAMAELGRTLAEVDRSMAELYRLIAELRQTKAEPGFMAGSSYDETLDLLSVATKDITKRCLKQYPENERIASMEFSSDIYFSFLNTAAKCNADDVTCIKANAEARQKMALELFEMQNKKASIQSSEYILQDLSSAYLQAMEELKHDRRMLTSPVTFIIERTRKQLLRYINFRDDKAEVGDNGKGACKEYVCDGNLCNSLANLKRHTTTKDGSTSSKKERQFYFEIEKFTFRILPNLE